MSIQNTEQSEHVQNNPNVSIQNTATVQPETFPQNK